MKIFRILALMILLSGCVWAGQNHQPNTSSCDIAEAPLFTLPDKATETGWLVYDHQNVLGYLPESEVKTALAGAYKVLRCDTYVIDRSDQHPDIVFLVWMDIASDRKTDAVLYADFNKNGKYDHIYWDNDSNEADGWIDHCLQINDPDKEISPEELGLR